MTKAKRRRHLSAFENSLFLFIRIAGEGGILPRPRLRASRSVHFSTEKYFCRLTTTVATGFTRGGISSSVSEAINFATGVSRFYALRVHFACSYIPGKLNFFYTPRGILHSTVVNFLRRFSFSLSLSLSLSFSFSGSLPELALQNVAREPLFSGRIVLYNLRYFTIARTAVTASTS